MSNGILYRHEDIAFIRESNSIEGIHRVPTEAEISEYLRFMSLREISINDMIQFVSTYQPGAALREFSGMNVYVGDYHPPAGDITIKTRLMDILNTANTNRGDARIAYKIHHLYEQLHPFMDCNGRSGRMLWKWAMRYAPLGFLHTWYYQSLQEHR